MIVGYARVSRAEQNLALQLDALREAGCDPVYSETSSGAKDDRPVLAECLRYVRGGDVLVVWKLDRLGRSLSHLLRTVADLEARGVGFRCLTQPIDTTTATGKLLFHMFGMLAEFERDLLRERTLAGLTAARARGRKGGRRPVLSASDARMALSLYNHGESVRRIARRFGVGTTTVYERIRELRAADVAQQQHSAAAPVDSPDLIGEPPVVVPAHVR